MLLAIALSLVPLQQVRYVGPAEFRDTRVSGLWTEFEMDSADGPERFAVYAPTVPVADAALLVHFHSFGLGHAEVGSFTDFMFEAEQRGWYLICPDQDLTGPDTTGMDLRTYGNPSAQLRMQTVLGWAAKKLPVDRDRIYAYGFSMGGGDVMSYAAQHLDPDGVMFAAVAQNAGTLSLPREYQSSIAAQMPLERAFGTTPQLNRYPFVRASSLEYEMGGAVDLDSPAINLANTPMQSWVDPADRPLLVEFATDLDWLLAPWMNHELHMVMGSPTSNPHRWDTFDFVAVCDWFDGIRLTIPVRGELVVAHDARYYDVWVVREDDDQFGRLTFDLDANGNTLFDRLEFRSIENIIELRVDAGVSGIPASFDVEMEKDATRPRFLRVDDYPSPPVALVLDGIDVTAQEGVLWAWENGTLTLLTPPSGPVTPAVAALWQVQ